MKRAILSKWGPRCHSGIRKSQSAFDTSLSHGSCSEFVLMNSEDPSVKHGFFQHTFLPAMRILPSADQDIVNASPPTSRRLTQVFDRTSQNLTVPSVEQLASSESLTGLNNTFSMPAEWPRSSVEYLTAGRSGFQMRRVRSAEPVAMSCPVGFHAIVRILWQRSDNRGQLGGSECEVTK